MVASRRQSATLPRPAFTWARWLLPSRRRRFEPIVGRVGRRVRGGFATLLTSSARRASASCRFMSWLRDVCALMTTTPSAVMRWSDRASSRSFTGSGSDDARMSNRRCTALDTLFTFCPPAPCARMAVNSTSAGSMAIMGPTAPAPAA